MDSNIAVGILYTSANGEERRVIARGYEPETVVYKTQAAEIKSCTLEEFVRWMERREDATPPSE